MTIGDDAPRVAAGGRRAAEARRRRSREPATGAPCSPAGTNLHVTLREFAPPTDAARPPSVRLARDHPEARAAQPPDPEARHAADRRRPASSRVERVLLGATPGQLAPLREQFAPAQFIEHDRRGEALRAARSSATTPASQVGGGDAVSADYVKQPRRRLRGHLHPASAAAESSSRSPRRCSTRSPAASAVAQSPLSAAQTRAVGARAPKVASRGEQFAVAVGARPDAARARARLRQRGRGARGACATRSSAIPALTASSRSSRSSRSKAA